MNTDGTKIKEQNYDFKTISSIQDLPADTIIDLVGVVMDVQPLSQIVSSRTQRELTKRSITVCDDSNASVGLFFVQ